MKIFTEKSFDRDYARLPRNIQNRVDKQLILLLTDPQHNSLQTQKMRGQPGRAGIWEARATASYRLTFKIIGDTYRLRRVGTHEIYRKP